MMLVLVGCSRLWATLRQEMNDWPKSPGPRPLIQEEHRGRDFGNFHCDTCSQLQWKPLHSWPMSYHLPIFMTLGARVCSRKIIKAMLQRAIDSHPPSLPLALPLESKSHLIVTRRHFCVSLVCTSERETALDWTAGPCVPSWIYIFIWSVMGS